MRAGGRSNDFTRRRVIYSAARGFTLIEVVVALVIILVLAAVALPQIDGYLQQKRVDATAQQLTEIATAIGAFNSGVNNTNPGRLSELSSPIIANNNAYNTGTDNSCGGTFSTQDAGRWNTSGPYVKFLIDRDAGMVTPIGIARDSLTRIPNSSNAGVLRVNFINSVALEDAALLDTAYDASTGPAGGFIWWDLPAVNGIVTMYARLPVNNDC